MYSTSTSLQRVLEGYWRRCQISKDLLVIYDFQRSRLIRGFLLEKVVFRGCRTNYLSRYCVGRRMLKSFASQLVCLSASLLPDKFQFIGSQRKVYVSRQRVSERVGREILRWVCLSISRVSSGDSRVYGFLKRLLGLQLLNNWEIIGKLCFSESPTRWLTFRSG